MSKLELYYFEECPYCQRVLTYLKRKNIHVSLRNIHSDADAHKTLVEKGGKDQVPCLFIDGKALYESNDIIHWFDENGEKYLA